MHKQDRAALFRTRLSDVMQRDGVTRSALARRVGADRSTIAQVLQDGAVRLPGGQLVAELAEALGVSADWLLGLTDRPERPGDVLAAALTLTGAERSTADAQIVAWHAEARGYKIRHVPATLPDLLKTEAVLRWEYAAADAQTADRAVEVAAGLLGWLNEAGSDYEIALPLGELRAFAQGAGYYEGLPLEVRRAQLDHMAEQCEALFPALRLFLFDARQVFSAPVSVFGPLLAVIYVGRFHIAFREGVRLRRLTEHFDWLVREAVVDARDAARTLREMSAALPRTTSHEKGA
ncbi:transcriptional regulator [Meridianimarinicoccus roseus]|uniref:Transcriptional regulator n=1 Tax=Meridianimarinicoccus roseus TaxID=2072018 RepID=A0A2V2LCK5_9RHOB|nr:helix-turn-helix transcriptional regulator [Meridianimarinicoccus roseus]PWR03270.1 transcriptional regulator [Meridianimarinicoccus roseus]